MTHTNICVVDEKDLLEEGTTKNMPGGKQINEEGQEFVRT